MQKWKSGKVVESSMFDVQSFPSSKLSRFFSFPLIEIKIKSMSKIKTEGILN